MAEASTDEDLERGATVEGSRAGARGGGVALADEGPDELPALLAFAVTIAVLAVALIWPTISPDTSGGTDSGAMAAADDHSDEGQADDGQAADDHSDDDGGAGADEGHEDDGAALGRPDIPAIQALLDGEVDGLTAEGAGNVVILAGVVPDEDTRVALIDAVASQPHVEVVDAEGLTVAAAGEASVAVTAAQVRIILEGTVPDEATRDALVSRAVAVYAEDQVEDRLVVDASVQPPTTVTIGGSMTDPVLFQQVVAAFDGIDGVEVGDVGGFTLEESSDLEAALNNLEPVQFASGSAIVQAESAAILDEAAALLLANPGVALEIGGHTDSLGGEEANQTLSEARAQAVLAALQERGVENELTAVGFGERRLKVSPDENDAEAQQQNRRIEFRIIG